MSAMRPQPRPGVLDIAAYVPGKSSAPGVAKIFKLSSNETPLGPSPRAVAAYKAVGRRISRTIRTAAASDLREAIGRAFGLDPERIVCGAGSDDLLHCWRRLSQRRRRGDLHDARLSDLSDRDARRRRDAGGGAGEELHRRCRRHPGCGDGEDQDRLPRQSEQSDRHRAAVRRGQAAAPRPAAAMCCWCSMRLTPNMSGATITRPASSWSRHRRMS